MELLTDSGPMNAQLRTDLAQGPTLGVQVRRALNVHGVTVTGPALTSPHEIKWRTCARRETRCGRTGICWKTAYADPSVDASFQLWEELRLTSLQNGLAKFPCPKLSCRLAKRLAHPGSVTPEWIDGGTAPHHCTPSRGGIHDDRSRRGLPDRAIQPIADADVLPFDLPLHGFLGSLLGVVLGAFLVTAALAGRDGVVDLARRSVRWRVPVRWYLVALFTVPVGATLISLAIYGPRALASPIGGWPRALAEVAAVFLLQLVLFQLAEEIGFTGFLQHHWQDRYHP